MIKTIRCFMVATALIFFSASAEKSPDVILILADDLGYGDLGCYGCEDIQTPNIDRLAAEGIRLTEGYVSAPYCGPSRAGLMTGRYQQRHGFWHNPAIQPVSQQLGLDVEEETLGDVMTRANYRTAAFGKWHLGAAECFHPNNRGFYEFYGFLGGGHCFFPAQYPDKMREWTTREEPPTPELFGYGTPLELSGMALPPREGYLTDLITTQAISFMKRFKHRSQFLYIAYNAPHVPLEAPEETIAKYEHIEDEKRRIYAAMVDNLDWNVGRILDFLEETARRENTLVIFMSDNGGKPNNGGDNGPLLGHKGMVTEGGVRVPMIWSWPGTLEQGTVKGGAVSALDLLPTFAALAGVEPAGKPLDGVNLLPWLLGEQADLPHDQLFWERDGSQGMRSGTMKLFRQGSKVWKLCDLSTDVGEQTDLSRQMPEAVKEMEQDYMRWLNTMPPERWTDPQL